ncbi:MAG: IS1 family transposase [Acidobacteria bacterium]|nr:IS1 family transposase [Acidobacteriota bacterium]
MNRLPKAKRAQILQMLVEGSSLRSITRITGVSINTATKLLIDAGNACAAFHDERVRNVPARRVQVDEVWTFTYAKQKNVEAAKQAPPEAGDTWTWTAFDVDHKLVVSWLVGQRDGVAAYAFVSDLASRLRHRIQLTADGHQPYVAAVEDVFGADVDFAQLIKVYGHESATEAERRYSPPTCKSTVVKPITGDPDPKHISTSGVERQNLNIRMGVRRFTRLTNAFTKKFENHCHHVALWTVWYNWCRRHGSLRTTPAQAAGLTETWHDAEWLVGIVNDYAGRSN